VGNLQFQENAVVDSGFTSIDQTNPDCVVGSTSNALDGSGKYGCNVGSAASAKMGRWYPSHYSFSGSLTASCTSGGFTYMDEDALGVLLTLKAHASSGGSASASDPVVSRYTYGGAVPYTNLAPVTISGDNGGTAVAVSRLSNPAFPSMPNTVRWSAGQMVISDTFAFSKLASADGPYDSFKLKAALSDPDGAVLIGTTQETNTTRIRYGQLRLSNAYGSELLKLPVPLEARYWNGTFYVTHTQDSCTTLNLSSVAMSAYTGNLTACETQISPTTTQTLSAGKLPGDGLVLSKPGPGNSGSVQLTLNVGASASGNTCVSSTSSAATAANRGWFGSNPTAKASFGVYKSPLIYLRENY
jgi:MSHA biogenesis protein MshQ